MAHSVVMPKLGNTVESSIIVKWHFEEGQRIAQDDILCEIETDKATMDVPAGASGVLLKRLRAEGDDVPVLEPIAIIGEPGEQYDAAAGAAASAADSVKATHDQEPEAQNRPSASPTGSAAASNPAGMVAASPRARKLAEKGMVSLEGIAGSGPHGRILERDVSAVLQNAHGFSSAARDAVGRGIAEIGTDFSGESGSGLGGRLLASDVARLAEKTREPGAGAAGQADYTDEPVKGIRKIISDRMLHSIQSSAQLTLNSSANADQLLALRARFKQSAPSLGLAGVTIGDMVAFALSRVLPRHLALNAHALPGIVRKYRHVHLGLAVDTPRGLMVPVIRYADSLSLKEISAQAKQLAKACVEGTISPDLLSGSTFTLTNLGAFGIESFTPILNEPETAILGLCSIVPRPKAEGNGSEMRIGLSLTIDHRIVDGADGARFLKNLAEVLAEFDLYLLTEGLKD